MFSPLPVARNLFVWKVQFSYCYDTHFFQQGMASFFFLHIKMVFDEIVISFVFIHIHIFFLSSEHIAVTVE